MLLRFDTGEPFASGAVAYSFSGIGISTRLTIEIEVDGWRTEAILDTGAPFLICSPELAETLGFETEDALIRNQEILIRGALITGGLHRLSLTILASEGNSLSLEVTAFVPDPSKNFGATHPAFVGYAGCLEWTRF